LDFAWREGTLPTCGCVGYFTVVIPASGIPQNAKFQNGVHLGALSTAVLKKTKLTHYTGQDFVERDGWVSHLSAGRGPRTNS